MESTAFYQRHLDNVSRSFAFCIAKLESPFRQWTSLAYLLCRVLDTVEDSLWETPTLRDSEYLEFDTFIKRLPTPTQVTDWAQRFPATIPEGEHALLKDSYSLFQDLHDLPLGARSALQDTVARMSVGMRHFSQNASKNGRLELKDLKEVNQYCYFVAGIVGELLSRLYCEYRPAFVAPPDFLKNAFHFGLFLQKVNLLKDQRKDEAEGRFLVPDRDALAASLKDHAIHAVEYLTSLPSEETAFRTFCAWSLFLGAASLPWLERSFQGEESSKIPRQVTEELLRQVEAMSCDDEALRSALCEFLKQLPQMPKNLHRQENNTEWFHRIRGTTLHLQELSEIGVI